MNPPKSTKPSILEQLTQMFDNLGEMPRKVLLGLLLLFFVMSASTTLLLAYLVFQPQITSFLNGQSNGQSSAQVTLTVSPAQVNLPAQTMLPAQVSLPTQIVLPAQVNISTQAPSCSGASLKIGSASLPFDSLQMGSSGSAQIPASNPAPAFWINNLENNTVFVLSPTQANLDLLAGVQAGETATVTWESCNTVLYTLLSPFPAEPGLDILLDQKSVGLVIYVPASSLGEGVTVEGSLTGEIITSPPTSAPSEVEAEISLLGTTTSPDKQTIQVQISILNYGALPITLSESDISLITENSASIALSSSDPNLPQNITPGDTMTISLVFPRPDSPTSTLIIFTIEYDLEDY
jgi:hypothetical protein